MQRCRSCATCGVVIQHHHQWMLHARDFPQHSWGGGVAAPVLQQDDDYAAADMEPPAGTAGEQTELAPPDLSELARREPGLETRGTYTFKNHVPPAPGRAVKERPRNYVMHQQSWKQLVSKAKTLVASEFWTVFETVRGQSQGLRARCSAQRRQCCSKRNVFWSAASRRASVS